MTDENLTVCGFTIAYCSLMMALVVLTMPMAERWGAPVALDLLLPCGLIGAVFLLYARRLRSDR